jgi:phage regulator Rha-like protein
MTTAYTTNRKRHGCDPVPFQNHISNELDLPIASTACQDNSTRTALITGTIEPRIDSRLLAQHLQNKHQSLFELIKNHRADFEELGLLRFQTGKAKGGRPEKFTMLNEDQSTLALSYSKNTPRVRQLKVMLVKAFGEARRAAEMRRTEYLPSYHRLSDAIHTAAAGSSNEKHVHGNVARLLNKTVGIEAGQRATAAVPQLAFMIVAQEMAARAMQSARNHHDGYQLVKQSMLALSECTKLEVGHG